MNFVSTFLASFLIWLMFASLVVIWFSRRDLTTKQLVHVMLVVISVFVASELVKAVFPTTRPFVMTGSTPLTVTVPTGGAFPSVHAGVAFAMAFGTMQHDKRLGLAFIPLALLVGLGRVMSEVHFFEDVIGGAIVAVIFALLLGYKRLITT